MAEVDSLSQLKLGEEPILNEIVEIVRRTLQVPTALVSIVDHDKQWFAAREGFTVCETPREYSICAHTILNSEPLILCDTHADPQFREHPIVVNEPNIRFYVGAPIVLSSGFRVGSLCALDYVPRDHPTAESLATLEGLARVAARTLDRIASTSARSSAVPLKDDQAAKSTFITLIGHELRTPLTVIFGSLQLLEATAGGEANKSLLNSARKSTKHLTGLVETIIEFSDFCTGELRLNEKVCNLEELLRDTTELNLPGADGVLKSVSLAEDSLAIPIYADPNQLRLALNAIFLNAINHGGPDITVGSRMDAIGNIELSITDNGRLDENVELAALYEPFIVGGNINNRAVRGGLGLGLPLTRKLVELHGGEFEVVAADDHTSAVIRLPAWRAKDTKVW
jgi:signal transduction histidine kinase